MTPSSSGRLVWTGPSGGLWSSSANWTDPVSHLHFAPSSTDQLLFGDGGTGAAGTLKIRVDNGQLSDRLTTTAAAAATLNGTLIIVAQSTLNANQNWTPITAAAGFGGTDFAVKTFPADGGNWVAGPPAGVNYPVHN